MLYLNLDRLLILSNQTLSVGKSAISMSKISKIALHWLKCTVDYCTATTNIIYLMILNFSNTHKIKISLKRLLWVSKT